MCAQAVHEKLFQLKIDIFKNNLKTLLSLPLESSEPFIRSLKGHLKKISALSKRAKH